jgi:hypothetical protein
METMELRSQSNAGLSRLGWVATVNRTTGLVTLLHGPLVEVHSNFFIEGVWNGPFELGDFGDTDCVFGTGGIIADDYVRFVTSAATVDYLYYKENRQKVTVSNSLPLLLASVRDALDPQCLEYPKICNSVMDGINAYLKDIPTKKGTVRRVTYRNLNVSHKQIWESDKVLPAKFNCFEDYRGYLRDNYAAIAANARSSARAHPVEILSTQSTGYDTTAVNSIARPYGIDKVFTVSQAKSNFYLAHNDDGKLPDDDGGSICEAMGLPFIRLNRKAFIEEFDQEALYYCALHQNQDANLKDVAKHIKNVTLLLTGTYGSIWDTKKAFSNRVVLDSDLKRSDLSTHGLSEFRLVVGFIQVPLAYIGARRMEDILNITESSEMDSWRLGNTYDRPIARRIAEEAGVPRSLFGQSKKGSVVIFCAPSIPYGTALRKQFFDFLVANKLMARPTTWLWPIVRWLNSILMLKGENNFSVVYYTERLISKLTGRAFEFQRLWSQRDGLLFCFCVNKTAGGYYTFLVHNPSQRSKDAVRSQAQTLPVAVSASL